MSVIDEMLQRYKLESDYDKVSAMKEIMQEIALCGLSRAGLFRKAAFYGGTALRMFYGLDRFSEDLDFSLMKPDEDFDIENYFSILKSEAEAYGLNISLEKKDKSKKTDIKSAFLKGNTKEHLLLFYNDSKIAKQPAGNDIIKIKIEIEVNPPAHAGFERKYRLLPSPYEVNMYDKGSLFAGKIHAVICRNWRNRVKGRDLYDYIYYLARNTNVNLKHLSARLAESNFIPENKQCDINDIKEMLNRRFETIDYRQAKEDVRPFIKNQNELELWSADFFMGVTDMLKGYA